MAVDDQEWFGEFPDRRLRMREATPEEAGPTRPGARMLAIVARGRAPVVSRTGAEPGTASPPDALTWAGSRANNEKNPASAPINKNGLVLRMISSSMMAQRTMHEPANVALSKMRYPGQYGYWGSSAATARRNGVARCARSEPAEPMLAQRVGADIVDPTRLTLSRQCARGPTACSCSTGGTLAVWQQPSPHISACASAGRL
jgi:hypothetical protein